MITIKKFPLLFAFILTIVLYLTSGNNILAAFTNASLSASTSSINFCGGSWPTITFTTWTNTSDTAQFYWKGPTDTGWTLIQNISGGGPNTITFTPSSGITTMGTYTFGIGASSNPPSYAQTTVSFSKATTRISNSVDDATPDPNQTITFTGKLECQRPNSTWSVVDNQTVAIKNGSTQLTTDNTDTSGNFSATYGVGAMTADLSTTSVYNGDAYYNSSTSSTVAITAPCAASGPSLSAPTDGEAKAHTSTTVGLSWTGSKFNSYHVTVRDTTPNPDVDVVSSYNNGATTTYSFTSPIQGHSYSWWIDGVKTGCTTKTSGRSFTVDKHPTRITGFTVDNIAPAANETVTFTGRLEYQNASSTWVGLDNQTVGIRNTNTGVQVAAGTTSSGNFSITYNVTSITGDLPMVPVYNGDASYVALTSPPSITVYAPISCPSGKYQAFSYDNWKTEACGGGNPNGPAKIYNLRVTNKANTQRTLDFTNGKEYWQCYLLHTNPYTDRHTHCEDMKPGGVTSGGQTCPPTPANTRTACGSFATDENVAFSQDLLTDEEGTPCGAAQVDLWPPDSQTIGPLWGLGWNRTCNLVDVVATDPSILQTAPYYVGQNITLTAIIRNIGKNFTAQETSPSISAESNGTNNRFKLFDSNNNNITLIDPIMSVSYMNASDDTVFCNPNATGGAKTNCRITESNWTPTQSGAYHFQVCADRTNTSDDSGYFAEFSGTNNCVQSAIFTVTAPDPGAFTITSVSPSCNESTPNNTIYWSASANVNPTGSPTGDRYEIYRATSSSGPWDTLIGTQASSGTVTFLDNSGLANSTTYWYRVRAVNQGGSVWATEPQGSATIESYSSTIDCTAPTVSLRVTPQGVSDPKSVTLLPTSTSTFTLTWATTQTAQLSSCTATGNWAGTPVDRTGGTTAALGPLAVGTYTYGINCTKTAGGTITTGNVTVTVVNPPTVDLVANGASTATVAVEDTANLTWTITNPITTCTPTSTPTDSTWNIRTITATNATGVPTASLTPAGAYSYTLSCTNTNIPSSISERTVSDSVNITASAITASCSPSPTTGVVDSPITWTAVPGGGTGIYTYSWSGSETLTGNTISVQKRYLTPTPEGEPPDKSATVRVTSGASFIDTTCSPLVKIDNVVLPPWIQTIDGDVHTNKGITVP